MESEIADYLSTRLEALLDGNYDIGNQRTIGVHDLGKSLQGTAVRKEIIDDQDFILRV